MPAEEQQLEAAIAALEAQRALLGDAIVDISVAPLRAKLAALAAPEPAQTLKQVTILFLDIVGLNRTQPAYRSGRAASGAGRHARRGTALVERYGGKVLKYAGDNLLAVFGAEEAREDDAERGVRAGLDLLDEGKRQARWC